MADVVDGNGENGISHRDFHAVHNGHGQRDLEDGGHALAGFALQFDGTAHLFDVAFNHVHAHATAGELSHLGVGGEAGQHEEIQNFLVGVLHIRTCQTIFNGLI